MRTSRRRGRGLGQQAWRVPGRVRQAPGQGARQRRDRRQFPGAARLPLRLRRSPRQPRSSSSNSSAGRHPQPHTSGPLTPDKHPRPRSSALAGRAATHTPATPGRRQPTRQRQRRRWQLWVTTAVTAAAAAEVVEVRVVCLRTAALLLRATAGQVRRRPSVLSQRGRRCARPDATRRRPCARARCHATCSAPSACTPSRRRSKRFCTHTSTVSEGVRGKAMHEGLGLVGYSKKPWLRLQHGGLC